jgi:hypothetical protein
MRRQPRGPSGRRRPSRWSSYANPMAARLAGLVARGGKDAEEVTGAEGRPKRLGEFQSWPEDGSSLIAPSSASERAEGSVPA